MTDPASPAQREWAKLHTSLGPVYTIDSACDRLGIGRKALKELVADDMILQLNTPDGMNVYPTFQFSALGELLPGLGDVIAELASGVDDPWTWCLWLVTPTESRGGRAAWELMRAGRPDVVAREASRAAWAWRP